MFVSYLVCFADMLALYSYGSGPGAKNFWVRLYIPASLLHIQHYTTFWNAHSLSHLPLVCI